MRKWLNALSLIGPVLTVALAVGLWYLATSRPEFLPPAGPALRGGLSDLHAKQVDIVIDRAKLYFGWALGIMAAIGFFLKALIDGDVSLRPRELLRIETALVLMIASIVFGEILISNALTMLQVNQFRSDEPFIQRYARTQYWLLLAGVVFTGWFVHEFFWRWIHEKSTSNLGGTDAGADRR